MSELSDAFRVERLQRLHLYFSSLERDEKLEKAETKVSGLTEGAYYWSVQSYDAESKESVPSETDRFTITQARPAISRFASTTSSGRCTNDRPM